MKTSFAPPGRHCAAYALLMVLIITSVSALIMAGTLKRTFTESKLNNRNNQYLANLNAAEAATEKIYARLAFDFQRYGLGQVQANLSSYRTSVPTNTENSYWSNFDFVNEQGVSGRIYVQTNGTLGTNSLPSQYSDRTAQPNSPIYRIISNVRSKTGLIRDMTNAVQVDVLLAYVPVTTYAIFYNGLLEFSRSATMAVNGSVHANGPIYYGTLSGYSQTFNGQVTSTSTITAPFNDGYSYVQTGGANFHPAFITNGISVTLAMNMTNTHSLIEIPTNTTAAYANSIEGAQLLYNQANVILQITNNSVTAVLHSGTSTSVPGADPGIVITTNNMSYAAITNLFPFLTITNNFIDQREASKTVFVSQIDLGKYKSWLTNNPTVAAKFPSGAPATILYVADNRTTNNTTTLFAVRVTNGVSLPEGGGVGFTLVTPGPLYVYGNYNCPSNSSVGNTNTYTAGTVPSALMSDSLTLLSSSWRDSQSSSAYTTRDPSDITVNAAILTGIVASTGTDANHFSGGVHNLPRLLEDWAGAGRSVTLNTSIINLFTSKVATNLFINPGSGSYYSAPTRYFNYDIKFKDPGQQPPGIPCALIPIRYNWSQPPPLVTTYNVTP